MFNCRVKAPQYKFPSYEVIQDKLEELGYQHYCPMSLLKDLVYFYVYKMRSKPVKYNKPIRKIDEEVIDFLKMLPYQMFLGNSPLERAINTLKDLAFRIDFRKFEEGELIPSNDIKDNFAFDSATISRYKLENEELDYDLKKILEVSNVVSDFVTNEILNNNITNLTYMKKYSEVINANYSSFVRPDFESKLTNKSLLVESKTGSPSKKQVIFVEDITSSMKKYRNHIKSVYFGLSNLNNEIHHYQVRNTLDDKGVVDPNYFLDCSVKYYISTVHIAGIINKLEELHLNDDVIFIYLTDSSFFIPNSLSLKKQWNFIFLEKANYKLKFLSNNSGGKTLVI